uniref:Uncharacterized protein n=1 Tax=Anguilla anguilla TaxID=7936 RepID=A0A0E9P8V8_ANGAN
MWPSAYSLTTFPPAYAHPYWSLMHFSAGETHWLRSRPK